MTSLLDEDTALHPARNGQVEHRLDALDLIWNFVPELPISEIDLNRTKALQSRDAQWYQEAVERYQEFLLRGEILPALVGYRDGRNGQVVLVDGLHREQAHEGVNHTTVPCYVIEEGDAEVVMTLVRWFNLRNGIPLDRKNQEKIALRLLTKGATREYAAEESGLSIQAVRTVWENFEAEELFKRLGVEYRTLRQGDMVRLSTLKSDDAIKETVAFVKENPTLTANEVSKLVTALNKERSLDGQRAILETRRALVAEAAAAARQANTPAAKARSVGTSAATSPSAAPAGPNEVARLNAAITNFMKVSPAKLALAVDDPDERKNVDKKLKDLIAHARTLRAEIDA